MRFKAVLELGEEKFLLSGEGRAKLVLDKIDALIKDEIKNVRSDPNGC